MSVVLDAGLTAVADTMSPSRKALLFSGTTKHIATNRKLHWRIGTLGEETCETPIIFWQFQFESAWTEQLLMNGHGIKVASLKITAGAVMGAIPAMCT